MRYFNGTPINAGRKESTPTLTPDQILMSGTDLWEDMRT